MSNEGLPSATPGPSSSGARFVGDDLQHLLGWYHLLRMLRPENEIVSVTFESLGAGNLDDVVVQYLDGHRDFYQVKAAVSAETALSSAWLQRAEVGRQSILQRFLASWRLIESRGVPSLLEFVTNRSRHPVDAVLLCRDQRGLLGDRLRRAPSGSPAAAGRQSWADHLGISEEELCQLLDVLRFSTDAIESTWRAHVINVSQGLGLKADEASLLAGIGQVREWIKVSRKSLTEVDVRLAIATLNLTDVEPYAILIIQALDRTEVSETVTTLDWVDRFVGESARTRRGLHQPSDWNALLLPELQETAQRVRKQGARILVRGEMRLPVWFAAGTALSDVSGAKPAALQHGDVWSSSDRGDRPEVLAMDEQAVGGGLELALTMAISADITPSVRAFLQERQGIGNHITLALAPGPDRLRIGSSADAMGAAVVLRDCVRSLVVDRKPPKLHLFLAMPGGLALLLGHLWDRMPSTQLYEDMLDGYQEAFLIAN
jgi:hypothetical protein